MLRRAVHVRVASESGRLGLAVKPQVTPYLARAQDCGELALAWLSPPLACCIPTVLANNEQHVTDCVMASFGSVLHLFAPVLNCLQHRTAPHRTASHIRYKLPRHKHGVMGKDSLVRHDCLF